MCYSLLSYWFNACFFFLIIQLISTKKNHTKTKKTQFTHFSYASSLTPASGIHRSALSMSLVLVVFRFHIEERSYGICLSLSYFSERNVLKVHGKIANGKISFFFTVGNIPRCIYTMFALSIHSSIAGHLGLLQIKLQ